MPTCCGPPTATSASTDRGTDLLTALNHWDTTGIDGETIDVFTEIDRRTPTTSSSRSRSPGAGHCIIYGEIYAMVSPDWFDKTGTTPSGLNLSALMDAVAKLGAAPAAAVKPGP